MKYDMAYELHSAQLYGVYGIPSGMNNMSHNNFFRIVLYYVVDYKGKP